MVFGNGIGAASFRKITGDGAPCNSSIGAFINKRLEVSIAVMVECCIENIFVELRCDDLIYIRALGNPGNVVNLGPIFSPIACYPDKLSEIETSCP